MKHNGRRSTILFSFICMIIGFMIAIQFQTNKDPQIKDTRNINELSVTLQKERERSQLLATEISKYDQLLYQYETSFDEEDKVAEIMGKELERIKQIAGFQEVVGEGFTIQISPLEEEEQVNHYFPPTIYDDDLGMIVNELNAYGAQAISINDQRIIATTAIRNVGDTILVNTIPIRPPYEFKVVGDHSILIPALRLAGLDEYFMIVNHSVQYEIKDSVTVPGFAQTVQPQYLKPVKEAD